LWIPSLKITAFCTVPSLIYFMSVTITDQDVLMVQD